MSVDVMIAGPAEAISSRPSDEMLNWLDRVIEDFYIRYGVVCLEDSDVTALERQFRHDPVAKMLLQKVDALKAGGSTPPYTIDIMISV